MNHKKQSKHKMQGHAHHIQVFKKKFWISLVLTIPILLLSELIQTWLNYTLTIPYQKEIIFLLSLIVYGYCGLPFLKGMIQELKKHQPGMMTLIGVAISVAFFYSSATVFVITGKDFLVRLLPPGQPDSRTIPLNK